MPLTEAQMTVSNDSIEQAQLKLGIVLQEGIIGLSRSHRCAGRLVAEIPLQQQKTGSIIPFILLLSRNLACSKRPTL